METRPLDGVVVVSLAPNLPGPVAAARYARLGARVTKVEAPSGDFMQRASAAYYQELSRGLEVVTIDLKSAAGRAELEHRLALADVLITSTRPGALAKLGLGWADLHMRHPQLVQVAIVGHPGEEAEIAGHDLTYQAGNGTIDPPHLPRVLMADLGGGERAAAAGLAGLVERARTGRGSYCEVALSDVAWDFAAPHRHGLTAHGGLLGGGLPEYDLYASADGFVAVAALEPHFWARLQQALDLPESAADSRPALTAVLATRTSADWQDWARERDIPIAAVLDPD